MIRLGNLVCIIISVLFLLAVPQESFGNNGLLPDTDVLTLSEASLFLRVTKDDVLQLADAGCLPGRKIGQHWRFSKKALLDWLAHKEPYADCNSSAEQKRDVSAASVPAHSSSAVHPKSPLIDFNEKAIIAQTELAAVSARGTAANDDSPDSQKQETIGEKPDYKTADEYLLRGEQVLLRPNQATIELGLFYSRSEQEGLTIVPVGNTPLLAYSEGEQNTAVSDFTFRYGLKNDLQFSTSIRYLYQNFKTLNTVPGLIDTYDENNSRSEFGDIIVGLRHTFLKEKLGRPDVILKAEGYIPTGDSSAALGAGISLVKRLDPVVLYSDFNYRYVFSREFEDPSRLQPENIIQAGLGYALSLNDRTAINASVSGTFTSHTTFDNPNLPELRSSQLFYLNLGMTNLITEKLNTDTSVSFSLNGPRSVTLGISLPYIFDIDFLSSHEK
jgi:excisionase family DNA binding protein